MFPQLTTNRLVLKEIGIQQQQQLFDIFSNNDVTQFYGMASFHSIEQAETLIQSFQTLYEAKRGIRWGIFEKGSDNLIGTIGFHNLAPAHYRTEIGYELHPNYQRKGYMQEAIEAASQYAFQAMQLTRIGAIVFVENVASQQLLLKSGFEQEGQLRNYMYQNNEPHDVIIFSKCVIKGTSL